MTDVPGGTGPDEPQGSPGDPWDAWRSWSRPSTGGPETNAWDAWKEWEWSPVQRQPIPSGGGCGGNAAGAIVAVVILVFLVLQTFGGALGGAEHLDADELIAGIDALPETGPRDQRPPDTAIGETATFPAPEHAPEDVATAIQSRVKAPSQSQSSGESTFLLYEEGTVAIGPAPGAGSGSEIVVFEDNQEATRHFPLLLAVPGWSGSLDTFESRARSRGGIGGFRGGGGGFGK